MARARRGGQHTQSPWGRLGRCPGLTLPGGKITAETHPIAGTALHPPEPLSPWGGGATVRATGCHHRSQEDGGSKPGWSRPSAGVPDSALYALGVFQYALESSVQVLSGLPWPRRSGQNPTHSSQAGHLAQGSLCRTSRPGHTGEMAGEGPADASVYTSPRTGVRAWPDRLRPGLPSVAAQPQAWSPPAWPLHTWAGMCSCCLWAPHPLSRWWACGSKRASGTATRRPSVPTMPPVPTTPR